MRELARRAAGATQALESAARPQRHRGLGHGARLLAVRHGGVVWGDQDDDASVATVHAALEAGINFFDTAKGYEAGKSEEVLGRALAGRRDRAVITTKVSPDHLAPDDLVASCEQSLRTLGTDYVDLYIIHWPSRQVRLAETRALERLKSRARSARSGSAISASATSATWSRSRPAPATSSHTACSGG